MKLSKQQQTMLDNAESLEVVWYDGGIFDKPGYAIRMHNSAGWSLLSRGGPIVYKTSGNAYSAARSFRSDLFPFYIIWGV